MYFSLWIHYPYLCYPNHVHVSNNCYLYSTDAALAWTSSATGTIAEDIAAETEIIQLVATDATGYIIASTSPAALSAWFEIVTTDRLRIATGQTVNYEDSNLAGDPRTVTITIR